MWLVKVLLVRNHHEIHYLDFGKGICWKNKRVCPSLGISFLGTSESLSKYMYVMRINVYNRHHDNLAVEIVHLFTLKQIKGNFKQNSVQSVQSMFDFLNKWIVNSRSLKVVLYASCLPLFHDPFYFYFRRPTMHFSLCLTFSFGGNLFLFRPK